MFKFYEFIIVIYKKKLTLKSEINVFACQIIVPDLKWYIYLFREIIKLQYMCECAYNDVLYEQKNCNILKDSFILIKTEAEGNMFW